MHRHTHNLETPDHTYDSGGARKVSDEGVCGGRGRRGGEWDSDIFMVGQGQMFNRGCFYIWSGKN